ncbi:MAG: polyprenyl synthetase family protein [archaeon]
MRFDETLQEYKKLIDDELVKFFGRIIRERTTNDFLLELYKDLEEFVLNGGKRLRPIALIQAYKAVKGSVDDEIVRASIAVELYHNSTLVHDDIMDEDESRRGKPTVFQHMKEYFLKDRAEESYRGPLFDRKSCRFAASQALLGGNILVELSKKPLLDSGFEEKRVINALRAMCDCAEAVNIGQVDDLVLETDKDADEDKYYDMIEKKTGRLFISSIQIGAILAGASEQQLKALSEYAKLAATTFQLHDDIIEILPDNKKGHERGSDIRQGKMTLLTIKALERGSDAQKKDLLKALGNPSASQEEINQAIKVIFDTGAIEYSKQLALKKIEEGKKWLSKAEFNEDGIAFFRDFADFMINREM